MQSQLLKFSIEETRQRERAGTEKWRETLSEEESLSFHPTAH